MKKYLFTQWLQRLTYGGGIVAIIVLFVFFFLYFFSKPQTSEIVLTDYAKLTFGGLECNDFDFSAVPTANQFPLSLSYLSPKAGLSFSTDKEFYNANLHITNAEQVLVTIEGEWGENKEPQTIILPLTRKIVLNVQAKEFRWSSQVRPADFEDIKGVLPRAITPTPESYCTDWENCFTEELPDEFDWIVEELPTIYTVGLCGENLAYLPRFESATLDDLYSVGVDIIPNVSQKRVALQMQFDDLISITSEGVTIPLGSLEGNHKDNTQHTTEY